MKRDFFSRIQNIKVINIAVFREFKIKINRKIRNNSNFTIPYIRKWLINKVLYLSKSNCYYVVTPNHSKKMDRFEKKNKKVLNFFCNNKNSF